MIEFTVRLFSKNNGFTATSFTEWIGHEVQITGLDQAHRHVLRSVENSEDGRSSLLTIHSTSRDELGPELTANMSVIMGCPRAQIRAHDHDTGEHIVTAHLDAPLHEGQAVLISGKPHLVTAASWPYRDPEHPESEQDYQHVTLTEAPDAPDLVSLGFASNMPYAAGLL